MSSNSPRPHKVKALAGLRFGRLTVIERVDPDTIYQPQKMKRALWVCQCDCGRQVTVRSNDLIAGTHSCGCLRGRPKKGETITQALQRRGLTGENHANDPAADDAAGAASVG